MNSPRYWFRAKRYGWGWGLPVTWEGWVVFAAWLGVFFMTVPRFRGSRHVLEHVLFVVGMVAVLFVVYWRKGEPARWRWGE